MAGLEAAVCFLVVPIAASAGAMLGGWLAYSDLRARADSENPGPQSLGRFLVYPAIVFTPVVFGLVAWFLSLPLTSQLDSANPPPGAGTASLLLVDSGVAFDIVVAVALTSQAWVAGARMAEFVGAGFRRAEPLIVVPEIASIFALTLVFLILGRAEAIVGAVPIVSATSVDSVVFSLELFSVGSVALLLGAVLSNQVEDLNGRGFFGALIREEVGVVVVLVLFVGAFLSLGNL